MIDDEKEDIDLSSKTKSKSEEKKKEETETKGDNDGEKVEDDNLVAIKVHSVDSGSMLSEEKKEGETYDGSSDEEEPNS